MAKKKSKSTSVSHWHRHHTVSHHFKQRPFFTLGIITIIFLLLTIIWLTLFIKFNYSLEVSSNTDNQEMLLQGK